MQFAADFIMFIFFILMASRWAHALVQVQGPTPAAPGQSSAPFPLTCSGQGWGETASATQDRNPVATLAMRLSAYVISICQFEHVSPKLDLQAG